MSDITPPGATQTVSDDENDNEIFFYAHELESDDGSSVAEDVFDENSEAGSGYDSDMSEPDFWHPPGVGFYDLDADFDFDFDFMSADDDFTSGEIDLSDPIAIFSDSFAAFNFDAEYLVYLDMYSGLFHNLAYNTEFLWEHDEMYPRLDVAWAQEIVEGLQRDMEDYEGVIAELAAIESRAYAAGNHELIERIDAVPAIRHDGEYVHMTVAELRGRISGLNEYIADLQQGMDEREAYSQENEHTYQGLDDYRKPLHWVAKKPEDTPDS